jgi:hypothetical protein
MGLNPTLYSVEVLNTGELPRKIINLEKSVQNQGKIEFVLVKYLSPRGGTYWPIKPCPRAKAGGEEIPATGIMAKYRPGRASLSCPAASTEISSLPFHSYLPSRRPITIF